MPLSKLYTRAKLRSFIRELSKEVSEDLVQDPAINGIIDLNLLDLCEMLNGATQPDYGTTAVLGDAAVHYDGSPEMATSYTDATKTIAHTAHGLTSASVGKRIVCFNILVGVPQYAGTSRIASIVDANSFTIADSMSTDMQTGTFYYQVLSNNSATYLDLSSLKLDKVIKLVDSTHGLVPLKPAFDIENVINLSHNSTEVFGYHEGENIYLVKGSGVTSWGTLTLHYYRLPDLPTSDTDYIDLKDNKMRLLVDKCVIDVFALAKLDAPKQLSDNVDNRTQAIRALNQEKEISLRTKQRT